MDDRLPLAFEMLERGFRFRFADALLATHARQLFIVYLSGQVSPDCDLFTVELVFGELLGNVARHAPGPVDVEIVWEDAGARLEVWDDGPGYELNLAVPDLLEESHRGLFLVAKCADCLRVERRAGRTVTSVLLPIERAVATGSVNALDEVRMNDRATPGDRIPPAAPVALVPGGVEERPPELVALVAARQRATEARAAAERAFREAQAAEAQLAAQEEQAIAAAAAAKRERLAENARAAVASERAAVETLAALHLEIQRVGSIKAQTEAAVTATRASLAEYEEQLRAAEASERELQGDIAIAEHNAQECARACEQAGAAQRAAERRAADAARAASG